MSVSLKSRDVGALNNTAIAHKDKGEFVLAIKFLERALSLDPTFEIGRKNISITYNDLGSRVKEQGQIDQAIENYNKAIKYWALPDAYYNLGVTYMENRRVDEAIPYYQQAIQLYPKYANAYNNLGAIYKDKHEFDKAVAHYLEALKIDPNFGIANNNLAVIYSMQGKITDAHECLRRAFHANPQSAESANMMGVVYRDEGKSKQAIIAFELAHRLNPNLMGPWDNKLLAMHDIPDMSNEAIFRAHVEWGLEFSPKYGKLPNPPNDPDPDRILKIGYVSSDFCTHAVAYFAEVALSHADKSQTQVYCYSTNQIEDAITERFKSYGPIWKKVGNAPALEIANLVRSDGIDILVDLGGHSGGNRLDVFAHKPAPIQVTWIGYANSTGLPEMDYRFSDALADPLDTEQQFTEFLVRLPGCFLCYTPRTPPEVAPLPALTNGYVTFASFNNFSKINPKVLRLWARVLAAVPTSRLFLKCKPFSDENIRQRVFAQFEEYGIPRNRLQLTAHVAAIKDHLSIYNTVDIALDTFPYAGTTTTCESLSMGVPVVTLKGKNHAHNVGVSLLSSVPAVSHLIGNNDDEYVRIAKELAENVPKLAELRQNLRPSMLASRLCDGPGFMKGVTQAYRDMWHRWCAAKKPQ